MTDTAKVIRLEPEVQRHVRARMARLPAGLHAFNDAGQKLLGEGLVAFFDSADDALFDMADKAQSNQEQNSFFDSMREVRVQRKGVESRFMDTIAEAFARLVAQDDRDALKDNGELSPEALSLVQNEDLEQLVAVEATVLRANRLYAAHITKVSELFGGLVPVAVEERNYPFGPQVVCLAMMGQIKRLDIDIKAKLVLFQLFDRIVIGQLGTYYSQLTELLAANADGLQSVVSAHPFSTNESEPLKIADVESESVPEASRTDNPQLLEVLSFIQKLPVSSSAEGGMDIERVIASVQHHRGSQLELSRVERETINLVDLMFRFILRDSDLASSFKELICRLQVPILKIALTDSGFIQDKRHPARKLLNEFAAVALQWNSKTEVTQTDSLFLFMKSLVDRILSHSNLGAALFNEALTDFSSFIEKDRRRSAVLEKRTVDAEDGKARAEHARQTVASEVRLRIMAHNLPSVVEELIVGPWSNVLFVTGLKYGFASVEWAEQMQVLSDLVWSVQTRTGKGDRQKLIRLVPELIQRMRRGLDAISYNPFEVSELFAELEEIHLARMRGDALPAEAAPELLDAPEVVALEENKVGEPEADVFINKTDEEMLADNDPHMVAAANFTQGAWFDLNHGSEDSLRCRLAAYIKPTRKFIFVDRSGVKVAEKTQNELALALRAGAIRSVDNSMLFDKALENVVSSLRKSKRDMPLDLR